MEISADTKKLVDLINDNSTNYIKNNYEISILIEEAIKSKSSPDFEKLIFKSKYVNGLKSVLSNRTITGDDYMEKIFKEFNDSIQNIVLILKSITENTTESTFRFFDEKYFALSQESMVNLMGLIEDLSLCKEFFNRFPELKIN
ncbi:MAG TPA: hypothetical protein PKD83_09805 [Ignavibacteria bacterium]|nr:hypothetical protein [Ignavibacteria bacterium]